MSADDGGPLFAPPVRNYSPWYQWMARLAATEHEDPLPEADPDPAAIPTWVERCRARLRELMGPSPTRVPLNVETLESTACDGYRRDKIVFDTEDTMSVPAYLLVPDARTGSPPGAAVLACHGHGPGKSQVVGLEHTDMPNADYALQLARRGYVVLAPDLRCFGERLDWNPEDHYACDTNLVHAAMAGWNPLTHNIWDLMRSLDVLQEHPLVDPDRVGMVGISYGGTVTLFTAALDQRVAAAVVSGYFSSWAESHKMPWNMCGSQILFGMLGRLEHEDLGALVAPRPLLIETGTEDLLFPVATATESVRRTRLVYDAGAASDRLVHDVFEGGHQWHGTEALPFLDRWLAHDPRPARAEQSARSRAGFAALLAIARVALLRCVTQHFVERGRGRAPEVVTSIGGRYFFPLVGGEIVAQPP